MNVYFILHILLKVAFSDDVFFINYFEVFKTVMNSRVVGIQKIRFTFGSQAAYNL